MAPLMTEPEMAARLELLQRGLGVECRFNCSGRHWTATLVDMQVSGSAGDIGGGGRTPLEAFADAWLQATEPERHPRHAFSAQQYAPGRLYTIVRGDNPVTWRYLVWDPANLNWVDRP